MQLSDSAILTIEGKVEAKVLKKLSRNYSLPENQLWVFVDYATTSISLNTQFDTLLEGDDKSLVPGIVVIKIIECLDQFGNSLSEIPEGWKTICKLEFYPVIPPKVDMLPSLSTWQFNPSRITLANHRNVRLNYSESYEHFNDIIALAYKSMIYYRFKTHSDIITVKEFYTYLEDILKIDHNKADNILTVFVQTGKIKPINNNRIELLPAV